MPEEVLCILLDYVFKLLDGGHMTPDDRIYPIVSLERYEQPSSIVGVGKAEPMTAAYGVVLRAEFVQANLLSGDHKNPTRDLYFKVLPRGVADIPGILLGFPALDVSPYGLGWQTREVSHWFSTLRVNMPRAELKLRSACMEELKKWNLNDPPTDSALSRDHCRFLSDAARSL